MSVVRLNPEQQAIQEVISRHLPRGVTSLSWEYDTRGRPHAFWYNMGNIVVEPSHLLIMDFIKDFRKSVDWVMLQKEGITEWLVDM